MTKFYEVTINPASGGFGMYNAVVHDSAWASEGDLIQEIYNCAWHSNADIYRLGEDTLPDNVEDIRGRIYHEPALVFARVENEDISYFGIAERS